jgi:hypothetical protein
MARGLDGFLISSMCMFEVILACAPNGVLWRCAVLKDPEKRGLSRFSGGLGEGETPLPIPNREVKPLSADGTWLARAWESRTPPVFTYGPPMGGPYAFWVGWQARQTPSGR